MKGTTSAPGCKHRHSVSRSLPYSFSVYTLLYPLEASYQHNEALWLLSCSYYRNMLWGENNLGLKRWGACAAGLSWGGKRPQGAGNSCWALLLSLTQRLHSSVQYWKSAHPVAEAEAGLPEGWVVSEDVSALCPRWRRQGAPPDNSFHLYFPFHWHWVWGT